MIPAVEAMGGEIVECAVLVDRSGGRATLTSPTTGRVYPLRSLWQLDLPTYEPGESTCPRCAAGEPLVAPGSAGRDRDIHRDRHRVRGRRLTLRGSPHAEPVRPGAGRWSSRVTAGAALLLSDTMPMDLGVSGRIARGHRNGHRRGSRRRGRHRGPGRRARVHPAHGRGRDARFPPRRARERQRSFRPATWPCTRRRRIPCASGTGWKATSAMPSGSRTPTTLTRPRRVPPRAPRR